MPKHADKYNLKSEGLKLEKEDPAKAASFYLNLLDNDLFVNDYYPYRRLVLMYKKTKDFENETSIIKKFFKSGVYANNYQFLWFLNKLKRLSEKNYIKKVEIETLSGIFREKSSKNKSLQNTPVVIADRIYKSKNKILIEDEARYDEKQKQYELEEMASQLNREKKYSEYIELLNHMIDDLGYNRYRYFQKLCITYHRLGDVENELKVIDRYFKGESTTTKISDEWFLKRLNDLKPLKASFKEPVSQNITDDDLDAPPLYEYDSRLPKAENLKRKGTMIQYAKSIENTNDKILYFKYLTNNTYFKNDYYPYRQLTILYTRKSDDTASLVNIKKLLYSKIYLNNYQLIWFSEKIRQLMEKDSVDEYTVRQWFDYYNSHGALMQKKLNKYLADRFIFENGKITVMSDDEYDHRQQRYAFFETGMIYERVGNYELAIKHYTNIIYTKEFNYYQFHKRLCLCLEKINDYKRELKAIQLYYDNPPLNRSSESDEWFLKRLNRVNHELER
ncbi:hypothetical protein [Methanobrevibacter sp.]